MSTKELKMVLMKMIIVSATFTIISCGTTSTNQVAKQQFESCTCLQEIDNANSYTSKVELHHFISQITD